MPVRDAGLVAGIRLFNDGRYLAAHEAIEELWEANEAGDADFYKGLIQASISLYKLSLGNVEGALQLYSGHRRFLGAFLPQHHEIDVVGFLGVMQTFYRPLLIDPDSPIPDSDSWPKILWAVESSA